jgi:hypothetical protein
LPPGGAEEGAIEEEDEAVDGAFQFADVAGPIVLLEAFDEGGFEGFEVFAEALVGLAEESEGEFGDILESGAERGEMEDDLGEAVIEVEAEELAGNVGFEVAVGGGDDADLDFVFGIAADAAGAAGFEEAEDFGLEGGVEVADFIEEEGAAGGLFDEAGAGFEGAGEGAFGDAEELGFEEVFGDGGAVEGDEGTGAARAVEGGGDAFLANAGFALDEDADVGGAEFGDGEAEPDDGVGTADEEFVRFKVATTIELDPEFLGGNGVVEGLGPAVVRVVGGEDIVGAIAHAGDDFGGGEDGESGEEEAVGFGELDAEAGPGWGGHGGAGDEVDEVGGIGGEVGDTAWGSGAPGEGGGVEFRSDGVGVWGRVDESDHTVMVVLGTEPIGQGRQGLAAVLILRCEGCSQGRARHSRGVLGGGWKPHGAGRLEACPTFGSQNENC